MIDLHAILQKHEDWLADRKGGERANLDGVNLRGANLDGVNLRGADLDGVNLRGRLALKPEPEEMANARLIAAAPELLGAMQVLLEIPQLHGNRAFSAMPFIERARAAIAKAKGEDA